VSARGAQPWDRDPRPGLLVLVFMLASLAFGALVAAVLLYHPFVAFDESFSAGIRSLSTPVLDRLFVAVTHLADFWSVAFGTAVLAGILLYRRRRAEAVLVVLTVAGGAFVGTVFRALIERARPGLEYARIPLPDSYSLPSGHALASFLFFGILCFVVALEAKSSVVRLWTLAGCVAVAGLIAFSRVYLGVHYFGDILASWILGSAWLTLCVAVYFAFTAPQQPE